MWQKIDPRWQKVWITMPRSSEWFGKNRKQATTFFLEDIKLRELVDTFYIRSAIHKCVVRRSETVCELLIFTAKPAVILGKDWSKLEEFKNLVLKNLHIDVIVQVKEIKVPELSAKIMAEFAAMQIENRMPHRRVWKTVLQKVMEKWAQWVKFQIWWRLGWTDISRTEKFIDGRLPLQTLRADIDYHYTTALTKYGILGIKVRICKWTIKSKEVKTSIVDKVLS